MMPLSFNRIVLSAPSSVIATLSIFLFSIFPLFVKVVVLPIVIVAAVLSLYMWPPALLVTVLFVEFE